MRLKGCDGAEQDKPLIGEVDAIVETDLGPVLVDWKTSSRRWPAAKAQLELQPTVYLHAAREGCLPKE